jgi:2-iminoacetate synthase ThiH
MFHSPLSLSLYPLCYRLLHAYKTFGEKAGQKGGPTWYLSNKVNMTYDSVQGIKRLRKEIVERMQIIMRLAKERKTQGMYKFVEEIYHRVSCLIFIPNQQQKFTCSSTLSTQPYPSKSNFKQLRKHYKSLHDLVVAFFWNFRVCV